MPDVSAFCPVCGRSTAPGDLFSRGLSDKAPSAFAYVLILPAIVFLLVPPFRHSRLIRFHCWQSLLFTLGSVILALVLRLMFVIFSSLALLAWLLLGIGAIGVFILWCVLVVKAAQGSRFELPVIGRWADRLAGSGPD